MMIEPGRGVVFAGTHQGGLYASEDGGKTWARRDKGIGSENVYSVNFSQSGGQVRLYVGTEPAQLYVSKDMGATWEELPTLRNVPSVEKWTFPGPPHVAHVKNIAFDPRSADTIFAGVEVGGAFKSTDAGKTWQELSGFYEDVHRIVIPPTHPDRVYISGGDGLWNSEDAGATWGHLTDRSYRIAYPDGLVAHPDIDGLLFQSGAICSPNGWRESHTADPKVARSRDGGKNWELLERGLPEHIHGNIEAMSMEVFPGGFTLSMGTTDGDVYFSEDQGDSWSSVASGLAPISKGGHWRGVGRLDGWQPATAGAAR
jgi:photosystem II stability/assembly factor-like uncharacterized protein